MEQLKWLLKNLDAGFICSPDNIDEIKNTILKVYELYKRQFSLPIPTEEVLQNLEEIILLNFLQNNFN